MLRVDGSYERVDGKTVNIQLTAENPADIDFAILNLLNLLNGQLERQVTANQTTMVHKRRCEHCGTPLSDGKKATAKYCSDTCRKAAHLARKAVRA